LPSHQTHFQPKSQTLPEQESQAPLSQLVIAQTVQPEAHSGSEPTFGATLICWVTEVGSGGFDGSVESASTAPAEAVKARAKAKALAILRFICCSS
jgi:hypothetical protein